MFQVVIYSLCLSFLVNFPTFAYEKKARLHYASNAAVNLLSESTLEMSQSLPGFSLSTKGSQTIQAVLSIENDRQKISGNQEPYHLNFVLKSIQITLSVNDEKLQFDSGQEESTLYLSQLSKLIDQPIRIVVGENLSFDSEGELFKQIVKEIPILQQVHPEALLAELFLHIFALRGEELMEGKVIERPFGLPDIPSMPKKIIYTITSIDDFSVYADIMGEIEKKIYTLSKMVQVGDKGGGQIQVSLNGTMQGKGKWNRDNAMLYDLEMEYAYSAMFKLGDVEWMMNIGVGVHNRTTLKN